MTNQNQETAETSTDITSNPEDETSEETEGKTKAGKFINKHKNKAKRSMNKAKQKLMIQLQFVLLILFAIVFFSWGTVEKVTTFLSGFKEVTIVSKTIDNGCYEIIIQTQESYCLDKNSYKLAEAGNTYHLEKMQYHHSLRVID